jgi:hypothetical protein
VRLSTEEIAVAQELRESWRKANEADRVADPLKWDHAKLLSEKRAQAKRPVSWSKLAVMSDMTESMCRQFVATWEMWGSAFQGVKYPLIQFDQARLAATEDIRAEQRRGNDFSIAKRVLRTRGCDMAPELADTFDRFPGLVEEVIGLLDERAMLEQQEEGEEAAVEPTEEAAPELEQEPEPEGAEEWLPVAGEPPATVTTAVPVSASEAPEMTEEEAAEARRRVAQARRVAEFRTRVAAAPGEALRHLGALEKAAKKHTPAAIESIELAETNDALTPAHRLEYVKGVDVLGDYVAKMRQTSPYQKNRRLAKLRDQAGVEELAVTE